MPALRAIVARVPASGLYHRHFYYGGVFSLARLAWGTSVNRRIQQEVSESGTARGVFAALIADHPEMLLHLPVDEIGEIFPMRLPWWRTWLQHPTEDDYWRRLEVVHRFAELRLPVYHVGGWHDDFVTVPLENFSAARRAHPDAPPDSQRLLMGMWPHAVNQRPDHGGIDYGPDAVIPLWERELRWLDRWVRGTGEPVAAEPPVRLFLMGANTWRAYQEWPPETTRPRELYLRSGGVLSFEEPGPEPPDSYRYDPLEPTAQPWDFGEPDLPVLEPWPLDPDPGPDRVLYRSAPLDTALTVIGDVWLRLLCRLERPRYGLVRVGGLGGSRHRTRAAPHVRVRAPGAIPDELLTPRTARTGRRRPLRDQPRGHRARASGGRAALLLHPEQLRAVVLAQSQHGRRQLPRPGSPDRGADGLPRPGTGLGDRASGRGGAVASLGKHLRGDSGAQCGQVMMEITSLRMPARTSGRPKESRSGAEWRRRAPGRPVLRPSRWRT